MLWLADECVGASLVERVRESGHDVVYILGDLAGMPDPEIVRLASEQGRLLLTEAGDFGELIFRYGSEAPGIVHMRIEPEQRQLKWPQLQLIIATMGPKLFGRTRSSNPHAFGRVGCPLLYNRFDIR